MVKRDDPAKADLTLHHVLSMSAGLEWAEDVLFGPLRIDHVRWDRLPCGLTDTDGGLYLRPRDMAKVGQTYLDGGTWRGEQVVPSRWVELSTRTHVETPNAPDYGYQWWCGDFRHHGRTDRAFLASGHGGQTIFVLPAFEAVVVVSQGVFRNPMGPLKGLAILNRHVLPAIDPHSRALPTVRLAVEDLDRYVGVFDAGAVSMTITRRDEVLHVEGSDGTTMDLVPLGNDRFRGTLFDLLDMRLEFEADAEGNVRGLTASFGFRESVLSKRI